MMKYVDTLVTFSEIPDEICLCINISNCPYHCSGCHSQYLWENVGYELTSEELKRLIDENPGISCVCFMGGTESDVLRLLYTTCVRCKVKTAWYTGQTNIPDYPVLSYLDYVKVGPYIKELGPLTSKTTNQKLYRVEHVSVPGFGEGQDITTDAVTLHDITFRFWEEKII